MAKLLKLRRGTTTQHGSFTGAEGEVTVDTDKETLVVHDGSTAGGHPVAAEDMANVSSASIAGRLANDSLATSKLAAGALPSDVTVATANIGADQITNALIADDQIDSEHYVDGSIDHAHLAGDCVDGDNIQDDVINSEHYAAGSIDHEHLANDIIDGDNIQDDVINSEHIAAGAVDLEHMSSESVDEDNLQISNSGTNGQYLQKQSGNTGGLTWATVDLTTLSASNLTSGTLPDARFPATLPAISGANLTGVQPFASGTKMIFQQTAAPTGWTKITSDVDNKALRVVSGTAGTGGTNAFSNTLADRSITANAANSTQAGNVSIANTTAGGNVSIANTSTSGTVNSHTLSTNEMPSHSHGMQFAASRNQYRSGGGPGVNGVSWVNYSANQYRSNQGSQSNIVQYTGGNSGHSHGFSGGSHTHNATLSGSAHTHNATFSGSAHNHSISVGNLDMAVQYLDVIIASKD